MKSGNLSANPNGYVFVTIVQKEPGTFSTGSITTWCTDETVGRLRLGTMFASGLITPAGSAQWKMALQYEASALSLETDRLENILIRCATPKDVDEIRQLVLDHGTTQWNSFPGVDLEKHLVNIAFGTDHALLAFDGRVLVGMVSFTTGSFYSEYESVTSKQEPTGYIVEALIHSKFANRGTGTQLLERAKAVLVGNGVSSIYAKRHVENRASAALMRTTGFQLIDVFPDPRRTSGSCRTAIERFSVTS